MFFKKHLYVVCFLFVILFSTKSNAQFAGKTSIYLAPRITVGYTIHAGFNYGLDFNTGLYKLSYNKSYINTGISLSVYYVNLSIVNHFIVTGNFMLENEYFNAKAGYGQMMYRWGYKKINKQYVDAFSYDLSISIPDRTVPAIGAKYLVVNPEKTREFNRGNYLSGYFYFRQPEIIIVD